MVARDELGQTLPAAGMRSAVRRRYAEAARTGSCCSGTSETVTQGLETSSELDLGCGNPVPFAGLRPGDVVLDLGCGSGAEVLKAARLVGPTGMAIGVDMTPEMLELARANLRASGLTNVHFLLGHIEALPLAGDSVDAIISNCVLNLSPEKSAALDEAFRVLRPDGRFVVADIVVEGSREPPSGWRRNLSAWSSCAAGAMTEAAYRGQLERAGFDDVMLERISGSCEEASYPTGCEQTGGVVNLVSDLILARKPGSRR
jgi:arsenite methyltransferase